MNYLVYRDLSKEKLHGISMGKEPIAENSLMLKEQVLPGAFDYPDTYIRHLSVTFKRKQYFIISMTDYELDIAKRASILAEAVQLLTQSTQ